MTSATGPGDPIGQPRPTGTPSWLPQGAERAAATQPTAPTAAVPPGAAPSGAVPPGATPLGAVPVVAAPAGWPPRAEPQRAEHAHAFAEHGHAAAPAPRRRGRTWLVVVLAVLLAGTTALSTYLWIRTVRYEEYAAGIEQQARAIGTDLATLRAEHDGTVGELAAVNEQLSTAQDRITQLADEKAQVGDDREIQRQLVDYQARVSRAAANVASALSTCIDAQNQLITYLENAAAYDPADLQRFKGDVQGVCKAATDANAELQRQLAAGAGG